MTTTRSARRCAETTGGAGVVVGPVSNEPPRRGLLAGSADRRGTAAAMLPVSARARSSGPEVAAPGFSTEHPGRPTSPMRPIGVGVRGARSIYRRVGCPNLLQRPRSGRSAERESLIFRASSRDRSGRGAPLQQIWTRLAPDCPRSPIRTTPRPPILAAATTPDPRTVAPSEKGPLRPSTSYSRGAGAVKHAPATFSRVGPPAQRRSPERITAIPRDARGSLGATRSGFSAASHPGTLMPAPVIGGAPGSARSPGNPRDRHLTAEHVTSPASTSARGTCSRVK